MLQRNNANFGASVLRFEDFDRPLYRTKLALREPRKPVGDCAMMTRLGQPLLTRIGQGEREASAVTRVLRAIDQARTHQRIDPAADRGGSTFQMVRDFIKRCRPLFGNDR